MSLWINGDWGAGRAEARSKTNPVTHEAVWRGNDADADQVNEAVKAARAAFPAWAKLPFSARQQIAENLLPCWKNIKKR